MKKKKGKRKSVDLRFGAAGAFSKKTFSNHESALHVVSRYTRSYVASHALHIYVKVRLIRLFSSNSLSFRHMTL